MRAGQPRTYRWLSAHRRKKLMKLSSLIDLVDLSWLSLLLFCLAVLGAAILRGFSGFGFALAAVPLASLIVAPTKAVAIAVLLQATVGVRDVIKGRSVLDWPGLKRLALGALVGTPLGLFGLVYLDAALTRLAIAAIVVVGVLLLLPKAHPDAPVRLHLAAPTGILAGLFGGLAAMPGPPVVAYYLSGATPPKVIRATMMVFFFFTALLALPGLALGGLLDGETLLLALIAIPLMLAGTTLGAAIFARAPNAAYRPVALVVLIVMALGSGLRGLLDVLG